MPQAARDRQARANWLEYFELSRLRGTSIMRRTACLVLSGLVWLLVLQSASGHHSFAVYDFGQQIEFVGEVDTLNFKNPHMAMTLRRTTSDGDVEIIDFVEGAPANMLVRLGLRPQMIQPGTRLTAIGSPLRDDPSKYFLRAVILEDGTEYSATR
jgi:hypothetical protein